VVSEAPDVGGAPEAPFFPGGTAVSGLQVYDWPADDGLSGGSPHVHLACTEAYVVVGGEGTLQTLTVQGPSQIPLRPGTVAWFGPGTIHRAVNGDGALRVVVLMQNGGLPEAGDAVLTFPPEVLANPAAYNAAASLLDPHASHAADATWPSRASTASWSAPPPGTRARWRSSTGRHWPCAWTGWRTGRHCGAADRRWPCSAPASTWPPCSRAASTTC
jgi:mannose-6-phosphate isomerase-like protein (cupin superfamily)